MTSPSLVAVKRDNTSSQASALSHRLTCHSGEDHDDDDDYGDVDDDDVDNDGSNVEDDNSNDDEANDDGNVKTGGKQHSNSLHDFSDLASARRHSSGVCALFLLDLN